MIVINKFYFLFFYILSSVILLTLAFNLLIKTNSDFTNYSNDDNVNDDTNMGTKIIGIIGIICFLFKEIGGLIYLMVKSNKFVPKAVLYYIFRSPFESLYMIYNIIFRKKIYPGFADITFSTTSRQYVQYTFLIIFPLLFYIIKKNMKNINNNIKKNDSETDSEEK